MSIIDSFDPERVAMINPSDFLTTDHRKLDACIFNFSYKIMDALLEADLLELVDDGTVKCVSNTFPIYVFKGTNIGVVKTYVGAPMTGGLLEDLCYAFSCKKVVLLQEGRSLRLLRRTGPGAHRRKAHCSHRRLPGRGHELPLRPRRRLYPHQKPRYRLCRAG